MSQTYNNLFFATSGNYFHKIFIVKNYSFMSHNEAIFYRFIPLSLAFAFVRIRFFSMDSFNFNIKYLAMRTKYFTTDEASTIYNVPKSTLYNLTKACNLKLTHYKQGNRLLFKKSDLDSYFAPKKVTPNPQ